MNWAVPGKASVLVGGQFGSEGKGLIASVLTHYDLNFYDRMPWHFATTNAGAQAGHTTEYADGRKFVCFHLPTAGVVNKESHIYINAGSIIDLDVLADELEATDTDPMRIWVDPNAAVITREDRINEGDRSSSTTRIGSTQKGVGSAIANKVMRRGKIARDYPELKSIVRTVDLNSALRFAHGVTVEVPQGTGLSLNHSGMYPYTTSRDCWVGSGLNDAGIHPSLVGNVCMVVRTFPIRVGSIYNEFGEKIGDSGPFFPDSRELSWEADFPGVTPERTTVTKRVRRIATWSRAQYRHALALNRPNMIALTFCNYCKSHEDLFNLVVSMEEDEKEILGEKINRKIFSPSKYTEYAYFTLEDVVKFMRKENPSW